MEREINATVLVDNTCCDDIPGEWGLSIYIEYKDKKILLDTGSSGLFADNAKKLGIDLSAVDYAVLSHAHYDHSDGMSTFFEINSKADFYLREGSAENCYDVDNGGEKYIGIKQGTLSEFEKRIVYVQGDYELMPGVWLIPHKTGKLSRIGEKMKLYIKTQNGMIPDGFKHEQSLVIETQKGLVIFNSCCHSGADVVISDVKNTFPDKTVYALVGGMHLFKSSEQDIDALGRQLKKTSISRIVTGHCTGEKAIEGLNKHIGGTLQQFYSGYNFFVEKSCKSI